MFRGIDHTALFFYGKARVGLRNCGRIIHQIHETIRFLTKIRNRTIHKFGLYTVHLYWKYEEISLKEHRPHTTHP